MLDSANVPEFLVLLVCDRCKSQRPPKVTKLTTKKLQVQCENCEHEGEITFYDIAQGSLELQRQAQEIETQRLAQQRIASRLRRQAVANKKVAKVTNGRAPK